MIAARPITERERQAGFTLVELMVSLAILAVILGMLASGAIAMQRANEDVDVRTDNTASTFTAMEAITRHVRAADVTVDNGPAFEIANAQHARFYVNTDVTEVPTRVEYQRFADGRLVRNVTPPTVASSGAVTYPAGNTTTRVLVTDVSDQTLFTYLRVDDTNTEVQLPASGASEAERRGIHRVRIDLRVSRNEQRTPGQEISTTVRIPSRRS